MDLVEFSVSNYRSITSAHKIKLGNYTVLVGKNNEGKSNLLNALDAAMNIMMKRRNHGYKEIYYVWERDFPLQLRERKRANGLVSNFNLNFKLKPEELDEFHSITGIRGNEDIPVSIKVGRDNIPDIEIPKRGSSSYNRKSNEIIKFISERIEYNYIQAIRTDEMAKRTLTSLIYRQLLSLEDDPDYLSAQNKLIELQQNLLDKLSAQLVEPLKVFLPSIQDIKIQLMLRSENNRIRFGNDYDIKIDDGVQTSISNKGDGIKSLVTLALLRERSNRKGSASVIAIEEPESHLHSGAIHALVDVINSISENNQVIITTHNPLFVQRNHLSHNIIVDDGTAKPAKSIDEIRKILGVWASDNLRSARYVLVVEGEDDKISLSKILPCYSEKVGKALKTSSLIIKSLGGTGNLSHDINDLNGSMCRYVVLLDNDEAGRTAATKATTKGLLKESDIKYTICNGSPEAEFEDCLNTNVYAKAISEEFHVDITDKTIFKGNKKWSEKIKDAFLSRGVLWTDKIEEKVKMIVANSIPDRIENINDIIIEQKSGFIQGLSDALEALLESENK